MKNIHLLMEAIRMTRNEMTFLGWGLIGEPQEEVIVQTGNGRGIDVTGYYEGDYWDGPNASDFKGPDPYGVVPVYEMPDGGIFPIGARQYPYNA